MNGFQYQIESYWLSKRKQILRSLGQVTGQKLFPETIIHKIFEPNDSFHMKQGTTGKVQFHIFKRVLLVLTKHSFCEED